MVLWNEIFATFFAIPNFHFAPFHLNECLATDLTEQTHVQQWCLLHSLHIVRIIRSTVV